MNAFKTGVTIFNVANMNELITPQSYKTILEGTAFDSKGGSGTTANIVRDYNFAIRFTATGVTSIMRVALKIDSDGTGQDLTLLVKNTDFDPGGSNEGTTLKTIVVPKEFLPTTAGFFSIAVNLTGLTAGANYWLIVPKVGDSTNQFYLVGESSQDADHPCYRRSGSSGAWTANTAIHFNAYSGDVGLPIHEIYGNACGTLEYSSGLLTKGYFYLPPSDGAAGGIRKVILFNFTSGLITGGSVA